MYYFGLINRFKNINMYKSEKNQINLSIDMKLTSASREAGEWV